MLRHWFRTKQQLIAIVDAALESRRRLQDQNAMLNAELGELDQRLRDLQKKNHTPDRPA